MLMLTLKEGDYVMLNENIRLQFVEDMSSKYIRFGIEAPKDVKIVRGKAYEKTLSEDMEKNAVKIAEIEVQKQAHILEKEKSKIKAKLKLLDKKKKKRAAKRSII